MKRVALSLSVISFCIISYAQPYSISFAGNGLSTVKVQNLTSGVIVDVPAGDVLLLSTTTGIPEIDNMKSSGLKVYPNPMTDKSVIEILPPVAGDAIISVFDITGKVLVQVKGYLENYTQEFSLSDVKNGFHIINVQGNGYQFSEKLLSNGKSTGTARILKINKNIQVAAEKKIKDSKGVQGNVNMTYTAGERLKYTALSGNNSTVMTDIPTADKTVTFAFTECKDGDNNYYPVVQIGTQLWMAENLRTTKFKDGVTPIPNITGYAWGALTTPSYCWYNNNEANNKATYGALYNWYTVNTGNLCPIGWHVPDDAEWIILITYSGGELVAGGKLKETGTAHWTIPNTDATNETGFTALPGGLRFRNGSFSDLGDLGIWWSSWEYTAIRAFNWYIFWFRGNAYRYHDEKQYGYSVRCLKD